MTVTARLMKFNSPEITLACSTGSGTSATAGTAYYGPRFDHDPITKAPRVCYH